MKQMEYILFSKANCSKCMTLQKCLQQKNIKTTLVKVNTIPEIGEYLNYPDDIDIENMSSFPIFVEKTNDGEFNVTNYTDTLKFFDIEPILMENENRYTLYPIKYDDIFEMYKKHRQCYWQPEEIDFSTDLADFKKLTNDEKYFIGHVLSFFSASDGIVNENIGDN